MNATKCRDSIDAALARSGWQRSLHRVQPCFMLPEHEAQLRRTAELADWDIYDLTSPHLQPPKAAQALRANAALPGPAKWVGGTNGVARCRVDVPREWVADGKRQPASFGNASDLGPQQLWADSLTALASGQPPTAEAAALDLDVACELLKRLGRPASIDDGLLRVHIQLPDLYRAICVSSDGGPALRVAAELIDLADVSGPSRRAAYGFASVANGRLPLVRLSQQRRKGAAPLSAEVVLGCGGAAVSAAWVATAVEAVEAAIELCARELAALADAALAEHVLAVLAAENSRKELCNVCENA